MNSSHVIRDVVHGYVTLDDLDRGVVDTPIVQRLRHIRQNDVAFLVFPSLNTTRFEHSLGVFHVARLLAESALESCDEKLRTTYLQTLRDELPEDLRDSFSDTTFGRAARWYGLLHDVGHLPFSHLTEHCIKPKKAELYPDSSFDKPHEAAGEFILTKDAVLAAALDRDKPAAYLVRRLLSSKRAEGALRPLKDIVDADVDADRIDSTARDGLMSGGNFGNYDIARLARHARLVRDGNEWRVLFTTRSLSAVESLLTERCNTHRWIHYQHKVVALKNAFRHCFDLIEIKLPEWKADRYVTEYGYLDDASVLRLIGALDKDLAPHQKAARGAILTRAKSAKALWKRKDEFRAICDKVVADSNELKSLGAGSGLALNHLATEGGALESALNEGLDDDVRFLVFKTKLGPFEESKLAPHVGTYKIVENRTGEVRLLTDESKLVTVLRDVMAAEPAFAVTVVGAEAVLAARWDALQARFVEKSRDLLVSLAKS